jgi:hypothetical protein
MGIIGNIQNNIVVIYEIMFLSNLGSREIFSKQYTSSNYYFTIVKN